MYRHLKRSNANSAIDHTRYTAMCNKVVSLLRESKQRFFDILNNLGTKQFWKTMRILNRKCSTIPSLQDENVAIESNTDKANALNSFFYRCFNYNFPPLTEFPNTLELNLPATESTIEEYVQSCNVGADTWRRTGVLTFDGNTKSYVQENSAPLRREVWTNIFIWYSC